MLKIILTAKPTYKSYSIEAGKADGIKNFDHHGELENNPSPCNDDRIKPIINTKNSIIEITHMDADTFLGIFRLLGKKLPDIDLSLLEKIDNNGSSVCKEKYNNTLLYMLGIGQLQKDLHFPRVLVELQDVTTIVKKMLLYSTNSIISMGKGVQESSETAYKKCVIDENKEKILFSINEKDNLNPSRAYEDGFNIVIVYRQHYKTISIYCNPISYYSFAGRTIAGIEFNGHPKACGSPRGTEYTLEEARKVFNILP